jgi:hypothetical protein
MKSAMCQPMQPSKPNRQRQKRRLNVSHALPKNRAKAIREIKTAVSASNASAKNALKLQQNAKRKKSW